MPGDGSLSAGANPGALDRQVYALLVLVAVQLALFAVIEPRGEFPLADDWAYAHSVRWLLDEHRIRLSEWIGMNLLPQTLAGGAAAWLFGYSFTTLRAVTQVVSGHRRVRDVPLVPGDGVRPPRRARRDAGRDRDSVWGLLANSLHDGPVRDAVRDPGRHVVREGASRARRSPHWRCATLLVRCGCPRAPGRRRRPGRHSPSPGSPRRDRSGCVRSASRSCR